MRMLFRLVVASWLAALAACNMQKGEPPPAKSAEPTAATPPVPPPPLPPPPTPQVAKSGSGSAVRPGTDITPACMAIGSHIADVVIASADPSQRSIFENDRVRIVRATGEVCTKQSWSDEALRCYTAAHTQPDIKVCEAKFPPQQPVAPAAGSGSAAAPAAPVKAGSGSGSAVRLRPEPGAR